VFVEGVALLKIGRRGTGRFGVSAGDFRTDLESEEVASG